MPAPSKADVLIVGGGTAGLAAAAEISRSRRTFILLEALDRLGGRVHTITDRNFPLPVELGAEFIHGRPQETWELARQAGAMPCSVPHQHWGSAAARFAQRSSESDCSGSSAG